MNFAYFFDRLLSTDALTRTLQLSGIIRTGWMILMGIILVKLGVDISIIAIVEGFFFLFNFSRFALLNGSRAYSFNQLKLSISSSTIFWSAQLLGFISGLVALMIVNLFPEAIFDSDYIEGLYTWLFISLIFSLSADLFDIYYIQKGSEHKIIRYSIVVFGLQTMILALGIRFEEQVSTALMWYCLWIILRWCHGFWLSRSWQIDWIKWVVFVGGVWPLILHALANGLMDYIDSWFVLNFYDPETFALYRFGARELPMIGIMTSAVVSGLLVIRSEVSISFRNQLRRLLVSLTPILCTVVILSPLLFSWVYSDTFRGAAIYFNIYAILFILRILVFQIYFYRAGDYWLLATLSISEILFNIALSLLLMNAMGIIGIPIATVLTEFAYRMVLMFIARVKYKIDLTAHVPWSIYASCCIALLVSFILSYSYL